MNTHSSYIMYHYRSAAVAAPSRAAAGKAAVAARQREAASASSAAGEAMNALHERGAHDNLIMTSL